MTAPDPKRKPRKKAAPQTKQPAPSAPKPDERLTLLDTALSKISEAHQAGLADPESFHTWLGGYLEALRDLDPGPPGPPDTAKTQEPEQEIPPA